MNFKRENVLRSLFFISKTIILIIKTDSINIQK